MWWWFDSDNDDLGAAVLGLGFGGWAFFNGFRVLRNKRLVENTPTSKCRSVAMGLVEIAGKATGETTIPSLVGQMPCYVSHIVVERWEKSGKNHKWVKKVDHKIVIPFFVEDETGRVKVNPEGAELHLESDIHYQTSDGLSLSFDLFDGRKEKGFVDPRVFKQFCASRGVNTSGKLRMTETNLCPGNQVYVLGMAAEVPGVQDEQQRIIIRKGKHHPWFCIAESSQKELMTKLGRSSWMHVFGGAGLSIACLAWLVFRLGWW